MQMMRYELEAWLGPALSDLTTEQVDRLHREAEAIHARYPGDEESQDAALSAAVQYVLGEITPEECARELRAARAAEARASAAAQQIAMMADGDADAGPVAEASTDRPS